ncbi:hypothetical protein ACD591_15960 [Rufibacter glacialis]|uniref:Uncharacterized protein n=1 Tax=Rufibacter glacialis TaxID=1259555 RepID=A0A5M8QQK5_9BACT|nr:hypothetical protein [Rufibacter glacialis]KAA6437558.1 hypothetical protein FOE74_03380 [Rufibacter glacialis]GGK58343.1 hypothetical protein GCM10011405_03000 [Rufibacter glacialis]
MENTTKDYSHIKGWGIDADPKNDPTYPMKNRTNGEHLGYSWERPTLQSETVEILHSNERPDVTAVFGTSTPPSGLSGMIRRMAFKKTENDYGHWLPLILADRINVVEGIIEDLRSGHVPNIFAEKGMKAEWKYNRSGLLRQIAVTAIIGYGVVAFYRAKKKRDRGY